MEGGRRVDPHPRAQLLQRRGTHGALEVHVHLGLGKRDEVGGKGHGGVDFARLCTDDRVSGATAWR